MLIKNSAILIAASFLSISLAAQENSPFSYYGAGDLKEQEFAAARAMGGLSAAYKSPFYINFANPASYPALQLTTFEAGIAGRTMKVSNPEMEYSTGDISIGYLAFAFPVNKRWTTSIGLVPFSSVNYDLTETDNLTGTADSAVTYSYTGDGALYRFYFGNGVKIGNFSVGANAAILFGKIENVTRVDYPGLENTFSTRHSQYTYPRGLTGDAGVQYEIKLNEKLKMLTGLTGRLSSSIKTDQYSFWERYDYAPGGVISILDTIGRDTALDGKLILPAQFSAGISLINDDQWLIGLEAAYAQWEDFSLFGQPEEKFKNSLRLALGGSIIPEEEAIGYLKRVEYRGGIYYGTSFLTEENEQFSDYGMTFGVGLPLPRLLSRVNLTFGVGQRANEAIDYSELYFSATAGFTLNDKWFHKRKIE